MTTPRQAQGAANPETERRNALHHAAYTAKKAEASEQQRNTAIRFASEAGASLREIADATGPPDMTVKRILDRQRTEAP